MIPLGLLLSTTMTAQAAGTPCLVPSQFETIQAAISDPGCDTIDLAPGLFQESVQISGGTITLRGSPGTVWQPGAEDWTLDAAKANLTLSGITFDGLGRSRALQLRAGTSATIESCTLVNGWSVYTGGAVHGYQIGNLTIRDSRFDGNGAKGIGAHMQVTEANKVLIERTAFLDGLGHDDGGAMHLARLSASMHDLWFENNVAADQAGAVQLFDTPNTTISGTMFCRNRSDQGGGAVVVRGTSSNVTVAGSLFIANEAGGEAGALQGLQGILSSVNNHFVGNLSAFQGGAILTRAIGFHHNGLFAQNTATLVDGFAYMDETDTPGSIDYALFFENTTWNSNIATHSGIESDPMFQGGGSKLPCEPEAYVPSAYSLAIDAGRPDLQDPDETTSDIGAFGGPLPYGLDDDGDGVQSALDCDDANKDRFPGAPEGCNGLDDDCDGAVDPQELDMDADGVRACEGDCDDLSGDVGPNVAEVPCNEVDDDCDPTTLDCPGGAEPRPEDPPGPDGCSCTTGGGPTPMMLIGSCLAWLGTRRRSRSVHHPPGV